MKLLTHYDCSCPTCRSASLARACASALGPATAHLHPTDTQTRQDVSQYLLQALSDHPSSSFKASCAHSLGLLAAGSSPASSSSKASAAHRDLAIQIVKGLLRMLCTLCPAVLAPARQLVESCSTWMHADCLSGVQSSASHDEDSETVLGVMSGMPPNPAEFAYDTCILSDSSCFLHLVNSTFTVTSWPRHICQGLHMLSAAHKALRTALFKGNTKAAMSDTGPVLIPECCQDHACLLQSTFKSYRPPQSCVMVIQMSHSRCHRAKCHRANVTEHNVTEQNITQHKQCRSGLLCTAGTEHLKLCRRCFQ